VAALIDRGLRRYGRGDLEGALGEWELALALDPEAKAAEDYITYVRENFDQLMQSFQAEQAIVEQVRSEGIPVPEDDVNEDDFPEIEVTEANSSWPRPPSAPGALGKGPGSRRRLSHEMSAVVDEGWDLDDLGSRPGASGRPRPASETGGMPIVTVKPRPASETPLEDSLLAGGATADDFEYSDLPPPPGMSVEDLPSQTIRQPASAMQDLDLAGTEAGPPPVSLEGGPGEGLSGAVPEGAFADPGLEDRETEARTTRSVPPPLGGDDEPEYVHEFKDEFSSQTTGVVPNEGDPRDPGPPEPEVEHEHVGGPPPPLDYDSVVEFTTPATGPRRRPTMDPQAPTPLTASPKPDPLLVIFHEARDAADKNDLASAVLAIERYFEADPELAHLDAREREVFLRIFEGFLGRVDQVPLVAVPMHEISAANLDHRTGFLLSRIDGMLTFEDILDVAGMSRLEAYRILGSLLRRGFIEVR